LALPLATIGCFLAGWFAAGQTWSNLLPFFSHIPALASGYNSAVGLEGLPILRSRGFLSISLLVISAIFRALAFLPSRGEPEPISTDGTAAELKRRRWLRTRRVVLASWLLGLLLLIWKHGFVRADMFHMGFFFGFAPFCALA